MTLNKVPLRDTDVRDKRVLMRVDFNVPMKGESVANNQRIIAAIPSIEFCLNSGAKCVVLMSHLGRPNGLPDGRYTLGPVCLELKKAMNKDVTFIRNYVTEDIDMEAMTQNASTGSIFMLENLRFHIEEEGKGLNDTGGKVTANPDDVEKFRATLSRLGDVYVNDAFGTAHRAHSSMIGVDHTIRVSGFLMEKELQYFEKVLEKPDRPFLGILGGAKIADKIQLVNNLLSKVNALIIGGGMAFTFMKVLYDMDIGQSLFDEEGAKIVPEIMATAKKQKVAIHLPTDYVCGSSFSNDATTCIATVQAGIPDNYMGLDIGSESTEKFRNVIKSAKLIFWNGPAGVFEIPKFADGTVGLMNEICAQTKAGKTTIVGGGDTAAAVIKYGRQKEFSHVSTGGGASIELLEGKELPGVTFLNDANPSSVLVSAGCD